MATIDKPEVGIPSIDKGNIEDLYSYDADNQAKETYLGYPIKPVQRGLPKQTQSLCPECAEVIPATLYDDDGKVYMKKECPEHGKYRELYWSDTEVYLNAEKHTFGDGRGIANPRVKKATKCPDHCGMCNMHVSHTGLANVDLTNRCNMDCPICFAHANESGMVHEVSYEDALQMLRNLREMEPQPCTVVQFSGGEPTVHPRFLDIVQAAKDMGFGHIQMASNGLKLLNLDFAKALKARGMHTVYLQFDGTNDEVHEKTRGKKGYFEKKLKVVENCREAGLRITLVPTIVRGYNDHMVGEILKFSLEHCKVIGGISFQPMSMTGRFNEKEREEMRYTLPDLMKDLEAQTGLVGPQDFFPISCTTPFSKFSSAVSGSPTMQLSCHPHCSQATFMMINREDPFNTAIPMPRWIDIPAMLSDMNKLAFKTNRSSFNLFTKISAFNSLRKHFKKDKAPKGLTFMKFLDSLNGVFNRNLGDERHTDWMIMLIGGMHFMDRYNYDVERVRRCVIHYSTQDGMYPFCAYNSGPIFRDRVEKNHSIPMEQYLAERKA